MGSYGSQKIKNIILLHPKLKDSVLYSEEQLQDTKISIYSDVGVHRAVAPGSQAPDVISPL